MEHCINEGGKGLLMQVFPPTVTITEIAANETKGLTRFSSGSAFPAGQ